MKAHQVFTPNDTPTVTYVDRSEHKLEETLRDYYQTPNVVISVSGPSKSGKTVLIKKVIPQDYLIPVVGAGISSAENLWERVLSWMDVPGETSSTKTSGHEISAEIEAGAKLKVPIIAEGKAGANIGGSHSNEVSTTVVFRRGGVTQVIKEIAKSDFVVFIDDFHYIKPELRDEIGRQIKVAAESGVKIVTASVPHRADDVVRSNPELRGRVAAVDLAYWSVDEVIQIAQKGFHTLNAKLSPSVQKQLATVAFGSPQLMQAICLNLCYDLDVRETPTVLANLEVSADKIGETLLHTSSFTNFSKMVSALHTGPRTRGTERKIHSFKDGSKGDVYRAILLAIKEEPAELSFPYEKILSRVQAVCVTDIPAGSSITSALAQMNVIGEEIQPGTSPISWDDDTLDIADPYFLFYLRYSGKLNELGHHAE